MTDLQNVRESHKTNKIEKYIENVATFKYLGTKHNTKTIYMKQLRANLIREMQF
jgi:hypothetical protein